MLYVERDEKGQIVSIRHNDDGRYLEKKSMIDEEVIEFLNIQGGVEAWVSILSKSDLGIIRILEDLITLLIEKNIIMFTDLPENAQEKIRERQQVRAKMKAVSLVVDDIL